MITGIAHACYTVADLDRSIKFYTEVLGLREAFDFRHEDGRRFGVYIHVGERTFIELFAGELAGKAEKQSYRHVCLEVDNLGKTVAAIRDAGAEVTDPKMGKDHSWQAWVNDPDGNPIELHEYTEESWQMKVL